MSRAKARILLMIYIPLLITVYMVNTVVMFL